MYEFTKMQLYDGILYTICGLAWGFHVKKHKGLALSVNSPYVSHIAAYGLLFKGYAVVAQLVRAQDCGS